MKHFKTLLVSLLLILSSIAVSAQQTVTTKAAKKWVKDREWAGVTDLKIYDGVDALEFYKQYHADTTLWQKVFAWLRTAQLDTLSKGKYPIDGDKAFATITEALSKEFDATGWESHRNYIDLQYVIKGQEKIGVADVKKATVTKPYDPARDLANYTADGTYYIALPDVFFLFFPQNAHRPGIKVDGFDVVKKLVIKIRVAQ